LSQSGSLEFAVRFVTYGATADEDIEIIVYNLSTSSTIIAINTGMNYINSNYSFYNPVISDGYNYIIDGGVV